MKLLVGFAAVHAVALQTKICWKLESILLRLESKKATLNLLGREVLCIASWLQLRSTSNSSTSAILKEGASDFSKVNGRRIARFFLPVSNSALSDLLL